MLAEAVYGYNPFNGNTNSAIWFIAHLNLDHSFWCYYNHSLYQSAFFYMAVAGTTAFSFCHCFFGDIHRGSSIFIDGDTFLGTGRSLSLRRVAGALCPRRALPAALVGASLGLIFPICECGTVPLARRLFRKGLPLPAGISFLLAAPVLNPIVILSTATAFGWGRMLLWRLGLSLLMAVSVGLAFSIEKDSANILRAPIFKMELPVLDHHSANETFLKKIWRALLISADEFFEMGRYLVLGASLAAILQTFISQTSLLAVGSGPILSVLIMLTLAVLLSICSTVNSFIALGFLGTFSFGSVLSFLVFGPMVDIKSILMFLQVFRRKTVFYLVLLPLLMSFLAGLAFNYFYV